MAQKRKEGKATPSSKGSPERSKKIQDLVEEGPKNLSPYKKYFGGDNSTEAEMIRKKKKTLANKDIRTGRFAHNQYVGRRSILD